MTFSVSCTTRPPRPHEQDGRDYHFISRGEYERHRRANTFLECAEVHGHGYGTLRQTVGEAMGAGHDVLLDIDVQGAAQLRARLADAPPDDLIGRGFVDIFIAPPSLDALRARLEGRAQDAPETIRRRLAAAAQELERRFEYAYLVVNDLVPRAAADLEAIVRAEHLRAAPFAGPRTNCMRK